MNQQDAKAFPGRGSLSPGEGQTPVVVYFQVTSSSCKHTYEEPTLKGLVYRERMVLALRWIEELGLPAASRMLDAGCGPSLSAVSLARRGYRVDAVDAAQRMIRFTRELARENGVDDKVTARAGNAQGLPHEEATFALVVALGLPPRFLDPDRVVKPGGYALLTANDRCCLNHLLDPTLDQAASLPRRAFRKIRRVFTFSRHKPDCAPAPPTFRHSIGTIDKWVRGSGLSKVRSGTAGFGPFMWLERPFLREKIGTRTHSFGMEGALI